MMYANQHTTASAHKDLTPKIAGVESTTADVEMQTVQICIVSIEGRNGGTFAHEQLAQSLSVGGVQ